MPIAKLLAVSLVFSGAVSAQLVVGTIDLWPLGLFGHR